MDALVVVQAGTKITLPGWLQLVILLVPVATLVLGLPVISRIGKNSGPENRKIALENRQLELQTEMLELELREKLGKADTTQEAQQVQRNLEEVREKRALVEAQTTEVGEGRTAGRVALFESVLARFVILYLTLHAWGLLSSLFSQILFTAFSGFFLSQLVGLFFIAGNLWITLALGLPLLRDVLGIERGGGKDLLPRWLRVKH